MRRFLLIPHLNIHNANAMSSPYTIGFPAITAWMGAVHALQRYLNYQGLRQINFTKVAVSCHSCNLQTYKGRGDFVSSIIGTSNPLEKDGERPAFIEAARCHLDVSLLIEYEGLNKNDEKSDEFKSLIDAHIPCMKWASGDLLNVDPVEEISVDEDDEKSIKNIVCRLMLGHVLIERRDLMIKAMSEGKDALEALLDYLKVMHRSIQDKQDKEETVIWTSKRKQMGWLVPIAVGFQGISPVGAAKYQRDSQTLHRFAESILTMGEFVMPYLIRNLDHMLWQYHVDLERNLYLCSTNPDILIQEK